MSPGTGTKDAFGVYVFLVQPRHKYSRMRGVERNTCPCPPGIAGKITQIETNLDQPWLPQLYQAATGVTGEGDKARTG